MRSLLLPLILLTGTATAQTSLFFEDFEGLTTGFTLNTTDVGSIAVGSNTWIINDSYAGGNGDLVCLGFPLPYTIVSTPGQPAGISNANNNYMHTASVEGIADGISCCSFAAADGIFGCIAPGNHFTRMTSDISTIGYPDVALSFWWLCAGANNIFGEVYYSTNGGVNWILIGTPITQYHFQNNWAQQTITMPQFGNQAMLRFGFRFSNNPVTSAQDPGFGIDDVAIIAQTTPVNSITCNIVPAAICAGSGGNVNYSAIGTFNPGNVFTAQLSDALGNFGSPVAIGALASTTSGVIAATIPPGTPAGASYRVRVVSTLPITTGTPSMPFTILEAPNAGLNAAVTICKATGIYQLINYLGGSPDPGGTWTFPGGGAFNGNLDSATDPGGDYTYTVAGLGGCSSDDAVVTVTLVDQANAGNGLPTSICSNSAPVSMITLLSGSPDPSGYWTAPGGLITDAIFDPAIDAPGVYTYIVIAPTPCPNDTAQLQITIVTEPDPGIGGTAVICTNAGPTDLFSFLTGTPDIGGSWTDPLSAPSTGIFTPGVSTPGLYTYTVAGTPPCANGVAQLAVVLDPCSGIAEQDLAAFAWLGQINGEQHEFGTPTGTITAVAVTDALGRTIPATWSNAGGRLVVDLGSSPTATYQIRIITGEADRVTRIVHTGAM